METKKWHQLSTIFTEILSVMKISALSTRVLSWKTICKILIMQSKTAIAMEIYA